MPRCRAMSTVTVTYGDDGPRRVIAERALTRYENQGWRVVDDDEETSANQEAESADGEEE